MKTKTFLPLCIGLCAASAFAETSERQSGTAQSSTTSTTMTAETAGAGTAVPAQQRVVEGERVVMSSGALAKIGANDRATRIDVEVTLADGTRVSPGGTVYLPDGTSTSLRDGQQISAGGKISAAPPQDVTAATAALARGTTGPGERAEALDRPASAGPAAPATASQRDSAGAETMRTTTGTSTAATPAPPVAEGPAPTTDNVPAAETTP